MKERLRRLIFELLGKDPDAVVVTFATGDPERVGRMLSEIRSLEPNRRHYLVCEGESVEVPGVTTIALRGSTAGDLYLRLREALRHKRVGLAPVLFDATPSPLRAAAVCFAPRRILAYNRNLERHHLRLSTAIASCLFLRGVPLDRIYLRPSWLSPWKQDRTRIPTEVTVREGRQPNARRTRVAVLSPYFPYPLAHGGAVRIFNLLREVSREFDIYLFAFAKDAARLEFGPLLEFCAKVITVEPPYYREPRWSTFTPPEVCEFRSPAMRNALDRARKEFAIPLLQVEYTQMAEYPGDILVEHDVTWDLYRQIWDRERTLSTWWNYTRWRIFEDRAVKRFRRVVTMSEKDSALLGTGPVIENGVDLQRFQPEPEKPGVRLLFVGSFNHFPNIEAFRFFQEQIWPHLRDPFPEIQLTVVAGRDHQAYWKWFTRMAELPADNRITIHDFVSDLRPLYAEANLVIVPTVVSAGTNLKVLEAMAMERAIVSTSCGCAGLGLKHGDSIWIADAPEAFAAGIAELLSDPSKRRAMAVRARTVAEAYDWPRLAQKQSALWKQA
jgi:glycosyltransferase involved in cell wall biosynthesis